MTQHNELALPRKLTVRADNRKVVLVKRAWESERHLLLKALVFGLHAGIYPNLAVERAIGNRFKPDLVALDPQDAPIFWAECGEVGRDKLAYLVRAFPATRIVIAKQVASLAPYEALVQVALGSTHRSQPVELLNFRSDAGRHIHDDGRIDVTFGDCDVIRFDAGGIQRHPAS